MFKAAGKAIMAVKRLGKHVDEEKSPKKSSLKTSANVVVGVRIRPQNSAELGAKMPTVFDASEEEVNVHEKNEDGNTVKNWSYDHVFGPSCSNEHIFNTVGYDLVDSALSGFNTVLFMYGQTSSGKTFTLFGGGKIEGMVGHTLDALEQKIRKSEDTEYVVKLTYTELYNEELKDLLSEKSNENLKIIDDPALGPLIQGVTEMPYMTAKQAKKDLADGENRRHFGVTNMNAHSSRSHVLVKLNIESRKVATKPKNPLRLNWGKDKPTCISSLNLVDLAGSERSNKSGTTGQALKEGSFINKSLLTLGTVISSLSEGKNEHIPYRNSKLTRLLSSALGGNAKTIMITCISPASGNIVESQSTLRFASRAKRIVNQVSKNEVMDAKALAARMETQNELIEVLRAKLQKGEELGFIEDSKGETVRDKAIAASKNLRSLAFIMKNVPKLIKALTAKGLRHEAEHVQAELKAAISGSKDPSKVLSNCADALQEHLPEELQLQGKFAQITQHNESDYIYDCADLQNGVHVLGDHDEGEGGGVMVMMTMIA